LAITNVRAHCVTLLRLAMQAELEHPGNAMQDESFGQALKLFSEEVEQQIETENAGKIFSLLLSICFYAFIFIFYCTAAEVEETPLVERSVNARRHSVRK
jgi:hypothetical protein